MITPIPKVGNSGLVSDLRPISILPVLSKIFERIVASQLRVFLEKHGVLPGCQSGFRSGYGCPSALLSITDDVFSALDRGELTALVMLDFSKAFDTINHGLLLSILRFIGLGELSLTFFKNYIFGRTQRVVLQGLSSECAAVCSGVPQGSILGPILFLIYTSSIYNLKHCKFHVYADDTQIYRSFNHNNIQENVNLINSDLLALVNLAKRHNLQLNASKCSVMLFGSKIPRDTAADSLELFVDGTPLPIVKSAKNLGIHFDSNLRFRPHVNNLIKKSYFALKTLYANRFMISQKLKIQLCDSLVLANFNFCDVVYGPCIDGVDGRRVQRVQNSCLRFIYGIRRRERISHMVERTGWLSMAARREFHSACFFYKLMLSKSPPYLYNRIQFRTDVHNINIRRKDLLTIPRHRLEIFKRSFSYCISNLINKLPLCLKNSTFGSFKSKLRSMMLRGELRLDI